MVLICFKMRHRFIGMATQFKATAMFGVNQKRLPQSTSVAQETKTLSLQFANTEEMGAEKTGNTGKPQEEMGL